MPAYGNSLVYYYLLRSVRGLFCDRARLVQSQTEVQHCSTIESAERVHTQCPRNLTRSENIFNGLVEKTISMDLLKSAFNKLQISYDKLEAAQDVFVAVAGDEAEIVDYLDEHSVKFQTVLIAYEEFEQQSIVDQLGILQD